MDRIAQFKKFADARPDDPFPRYALALEYRSAGDAPAAIAELTLLTQRAPTYVPAYLMLGQLLEAAGRPDDAKSTYRAGQQQARAQHNTHALSELTSSLAQLGEA